jgi:hypothetical protein
MTLRGALFGSLAALALLLAGARMGRAAAATLISVHDVAIGDDAYVGGFELAIAGLQVVAVCHVPDDWRITVAHGSPPDSFTSGFAHHGASSLPAPELGRLQRLFLVEPTRTSAGSTAPKSITGFLWVGRYGDSSGRRKSPLRPGNIAWEPATGCRSSEAVGALC